MPERDNREEVREPPSEVIAAMARHARREHGRDFDLYRDVFFAGNPVRPAAFDWIAQTAKSPAIVLCNEPGCEGLRLIVGEVAYGSPERNAYLQLHDKGLQPLLRGASQEDREALTEAYDRGELPGLLAAQAAARRGRATAVKHGPAYERRLRGFREHFLKAYAELDTIEAVLEQLVDMHSADPDRYRAILGTSRRYEAETFRDYMQATTTAAEREQVRQQRLDRKRAERDARRATVEPTG